MPLPTVSRALNPHTEKQLTPEVVADVRRISRELDYRPNAFRRICPAE
jgi:DNA-binding LacI/PurR family transcriptional regulator